MKLIVGLGNPGAKYHNTRHNVGFLALDYFLEQASQNSELVPQTISWDNNFDSHIATLTLDGEKILFIKPQTFMNESGRAISSVLSFYKVSFAENLLVIHDEVDFPLGTVRETNDSSAAGHNGIKSIIENLGTQNFHRLRVGVETRPNRAHMPTDAFVLENFSAEEMTRLKEEVLPDIAKKITQFINK